MPIMMDYRAPGTKARAAALAGAAEAAAAKLHDVATSACEVSGVDTAAAGPLRGKVQQAVSAATGAGRDVVALVRQFPLVAVVAGLGVGFKIAQAIYRAAPNKRDNEQA